MLKCRNEKMAVSLSEVLEVRGSGLAETEAWMLLNELVSQIKENTISSTIIQPDNLLFFSDGTLCIDKVTPGKEMFHELEVFEEIGYEQRIICSIGLTVLWGLQYSSKKVKHIPITGNLVSLLDTMVSQDAGFSFISQICKRCKANLADHRADSPSRHFKDFYRSIFGNVIKIHRPATQEKSFKSEATMTERSPAKLAQSKYRDPAIAVERLQQTFGDFSDTEPRRKERSRHSSQEDTTPHNAYFPTPTPRRLARQINGPDSLRQRSQTKQGSLLKSKDPPLHIRFHDSEKTRKDLNKVAVEFVNQKRLVVTMNSHKTNCGVLLDSAVTHLVGASDSSLFALAVFVDGEYIFVRNESKVHKIITAFGITEDPRFQLRLKFMPHDAGSYGDENFLQAIYLQTRKDILEGRVLCRQDQALHLAAYALRYEVENMADVASFVVGDYVPAGILQRTGMSNARTLVLQLHAQLRDLTPLESRKQYLLKARELSDFGTNFCIIYWSQKYHPESLAWLGVNSQGVNLFELKQCEIRNKVHSFTWDQLVKIGYKGTCVSLAKKGGTKCKFYVKNPHKAKYVVGIVGVTHRFYRFEDCHPNELLHQFHHLDDLKNNGHVQPRPDNINSKSRREASFILPFKRVPVKREAEVSQPHSPPRTKSSSQPSSVVEAEEAASDVFSPADLPEIIPYAPTDDSAPSLDVPVVSAPELEDVTHPFVNGNLPVEVIVHETMSVPSDSTGSELSPDEQLGDEPVSSARSEKDHLLLGGSTPSLAERSCVILLEKKNGTFGFSIMGGADKPTSVIKVHHIVEGGAADLNGNLHKGDVLLAINDVPLHEVTHKRAVEILSNAPTKSRLTLLKRGSSSMSLHGMAAPTDAEDAATSVVENVSSDEEQGYSVHPVAEERTGKRLPVSYDDRVLQVASAFYNDQYTDLEPSFQHAYIGSGGENLSFEIIGAADTSVREEVASRGEGDGVSTLSAQDHGQSQVYSSRDSGAERPKNEDEVFTAATETIANFEEFRRRMSGLQQANKSSENSEDTESWTTVDT